MTIKEANEQSNGTSGSEPPGSKPKDGRTAGATSGTENYGGTEQANELNLPENQTEPSY